MVEPLLTVRDLRVAFGDEGRAVNAVDGVSFDVYPGETLGIVGESGSGKSVSVMSMLGLIPQPPGRIVGGSAVFEGRDLLTMSPRELRAVRGASIGMIFQDAMTALNPVLTIGFQLAESIRVHRPMSRADARTRAAELLTAVGVSNPEARLKQYPHEYSGGMRQRAMIAMAVANSPQLVIADEPTTALDVTIQAQVLDVLRKAKDDADAATILITHDLGVVAEMADRVAVMYSGQIVESGTVEQVFRSPSHPYTVGLLGSLPRLDSRFERLIPIRGNPPSGRQQPTGCRFSPRCDLSGGRSACVEEQPALVRAADGTESRCHFREEVAGFRDTIRSAEMSHQAPADTERKEAR
ncbi:ABC transporter ATP-binding protein [Georgenia sp. MJ173]|uniref:ABC transporter ATP-binding protein n=1 Tax=Georgenia sunbinii TaxID=3117728 RepID=UPI002F264B11